ncbi:MAG: hypothetical protein ABI581_05130 [Sediminibacterium sp.]
MLSNHNFLPDNLGAVTDLLPIPQKDFGRVPLYLSHAYQLYQAKVFGIEVVLARLQHPENLTTGGIMKNLTIFQGIFGSVVVLVADDMTGIRKRRLIQDRVNFIVPGKQMFLPALMVDLTEQADTRNYPQTKDTLLPSAQFILLYHILHKIKYPQPQIEDLPFKNLAKLLHYTPMAISNAVENLVLHGLCRVEGTKEKFIHFIAERNELWEMAGNYFINPVLKTVYADAMPTGNIYRKTGINALAEYGDLNPEEPVHYALGKQTYFALEKTGALKNVNSEEGNVTIEVWKYDPEPLAFGISHEGNVDPLSLCLIFKDTEDERINMALDQLLEKYL